MQLSSDGVHLDQVNSRTLDNEERGDDFLPPILKQYWGAISRRRYVIFAILTVALALGVAVTLLMSPTYTATAQLEIERSQKQITNVEGVEAQNAAQDQEFYATQYALLRTRPVMERVARELQLTSNEEFFAAHGIDPASLEELGSASGRDQRLDVVVNLLAQHASIDPVRTSRLVDVSYNSRSPSISARVANAWAAAFIAVSMDRQFASTADARKFLEERLATLRERLEQSERAAVNYAADQGIVALDQVRDSEGVTLGSRTLAAANLDALNSALNEAISDRVRAQAALTGSGANSPEAIGSATLASLRQQREVAAAERARLLVQFEPGYPAIQALERQIASLDAAIARETSRIGSSRGDTYRQAAQREAALRAQVNALRGQLTDQNRASIQYNIYQRDADTNRQLYDALLQRYKEIGVAGTVGISNISIVEEAELPEAPSSPNLLLNLALALLAGGLAAGLTVIALEQIDEGFRNPGEVRTRLGLPLLGTAPDVAGDVVDQIADSKSEIYESYFSIRSNLAFTTEHGFPRSLSITSTRPAEGKSISSLALATILARLGKKVLLLDADMRSPSIHALTGKENVTGLSNYLSGTDDWRAMVKPGSQPSLSIMTSGPVPPSAAELLSGARLTALIEAMLKEYDHVVVDSPPVLGLADAPIISRTVEGSILVIESAGPAVRAVRTSVHRLNQIGGHLFGAILTKVNQESGGYGYGYGYGYGFKYGDSDDPSRASAA